METSNMTGMVAINKWMYFCWNYESDIIGRVWEGKDIRFHLQSKFDYLYERYGSRGVMDAFYGELDGNNRRTLLDWVLTNFKGEQKLF